MVYILCERVIATYRGLQYICFVDNLFVDVNLARALLAINIGFMRYHEEERAWYTTNLACNTAQVS